MPYHQNLHHHHARAAEPQPQVKTVESVVYVTAEANFDGPIGGYSTQDGGSEPTPAPVAAPKPKPKLPPPAVAPDAQVRPPSGGSNKGSSGGQPSFYDAGSSSGSSSPSSGDSSGSSSGSGSGSSSGSDSGSDSGSGGSGAVKGKPVSHQNPLSVAATEEYGSKPTGHKSAIAGTPIRHSASPATTEAKSTGGSSYKDSDSSSGSSAAGNAGSSSAPSAKPEASSSGMSSGGKAGLAIGIIAIACIIAGIAFFFYRRKKKQANGQKLDDEKSGYNEKSGFDAMQPGLVPRVSVKKPGAQAPRLSMRPVTNMFDGDAEKPREAPTAGASIVNDPAIAAAAAKAPKPQKPAEAHNPFGDDNAAPVEAPKPLNISRPGTPTGQQSEGFKNSPAMDAPAAAVVHAANGAGAAPPNRPPPTNVHRVQLDFAPSMDDELELRAGTLVRLLHEYDDGWALCNRLNGEKQGVCPRSCLSKLPVKPRPPPPNHGPNGSPQQRPRGPPPPGVRTRPNGPPPQGAPRMRSATNGGPPPVGGPAPQGTPFNPFGDENRARSNSAGSPPKTGSSPTLGSNGLPSRKPVGGGSL